MSACAGDVVKQRIGTLILFGIKVFLFPETNCEFCEIITDKGIFLW